MKGQRQLACRAEQQVHPERGGLAAHGDLAAPDACARSEIAALVELAVVGQISLGDDAEDAAAVDHHRRVVEPARASQGRADDQHRKQFAAGVGDRGDPCFDRIQHRILQQQLVQRIGRDAEFREHHHGRAGRIPLAGQLQRRLDVERRIGRLHARHGRRDADELVAVQAMERTLAHPGLSGDARIGF